ncbi:sulfatase-like hydrolase/transferase [Enhygromyxa salina]|uniref:Arylsulfatase n=1 Tax=Enhygromyxa salina TaxID=215803 RepID=A0A2S9YIH4_9BACT|nr:sulfatase-like hydrolase/transferase [Enhygromyxa salina]PRQ04914.1 Arylsulfatase [Enhygromyxa salina]
MTPNILIILADDIGVDAFRINPQAKTVFAKVEGESDTAGPVRLPTFSNLLANGVHFAHAWAHPVCTPTRASLWTGTQPWRTGLGYPTGGGDELPDQTVTGEPVVSLAQALGDRYRCAMFGKWDLGPSKNPVEWGWNYFAGIFRGGLRVDGVRQYGFPPPPSRIGYDRLRNAEGSSRAEKCRAAADVLAAKYDETFLANNPDLRFYIWEKDIVKADGTVEANQPPSARDYPYATEDQVEDAKRWIAAQAGERPWCVALNLITPHDPFHVPPPGTFRADTITNPAAPTVQEMLVAMLESMDHYVGDLLQAIDEQLDNTVIIFVGDNGTQDRDADTNQSVDKRLGDDKSTESIGGIHVPMIVADGGLLAGKAPCYIQGSARTVASPAHIIDVYNTVLDIAGGSDRATADSLSFAPHLTGTGGTTRTHNFSQMFLEPSNGTSPGINASASDTKSEYKLTCKLLTNAQSQVVDRDGKPTTQQVYDYEFSRLDPEEGIPGSSVETPIDALTANSDGTFTVSDLNYQAKILELYAVLREQFLSNAKNSVPIITPQDTVMSFNPADTRWSVTAMNDSGAIGSFHPTPWAFADDGTMNASPHWTGKYELIPGSDHSYACSISNGDEFMVHFVSPTRFVSTRNGVLYRFGKKL